jgi:hypothetical protein
MRAAGHEPPTEAELGADVAELPAVRAAGRAVRICRSRYAHPDAIGSVRARVEAVSGARWARGRCSRRACRAARRSARRRDRRRLERPGAGAPTGLQSHDQRIFSRR